MQLNDPRLTAFVLGELNAEDAKAVKDAMQTNKAIAQEITAIEDSIQLVSQGYQSDQPKLTASQRAKIYSAGSDLNIEDINSVSNRSSKITWISASIGAAAAVALIMVFAKNNRSSPDTVAFKDFSASQLSERIGAAQLPWSQQTTQAEPSDISPLEKALNSSPAEFRNTLVEHVHDTLHLSTSTVPRFASEWLRPTEQNSVTLPLTSSTLSWEWISQTAHTGGTLNPSLVRAEELMNAVSLPSSENMALQGITAGLDFSPCPWNENALLAVIHIKNSKKVAISDVGAGLSLSLQPTQFRLIGYHSDEDSALDSATRSTLDGKYSQTVIYQLDFDTTPPHSKSLATLHLSVGEEQRTMIFNYDPLQPTALSPASTFAIATSQWAKIIQDGSHSDEEQSELKNTLNTLKESSRSTKAAEVYKTLSSFL